MISSLERRLLLNSLISAHDQQTLVRLCYGVRLTNTEKRALLSALGCDCPRAISAKEHRDTCPVRDIRVPIVTPVIDDEDEEHAH